MQDDGVTSQHHAADTANSHYDHAGNQRGFGKFHGVLLIQTGGLYGEVAVKYTRLAKQRDRLPFLLPGFNLHTLRGGGVITAPDE